MEPKKYDAIVLVTPDRFERLYNQYKYYLRYMPVRNINILGSEHVGELFDAKVGEIASNNEELSRLHFICEDSILSFSLVHETIRHEMESILKGRELPRGITGWYYQQFLKLSYSYMCSDEYYLVWDGDTFPCCDFTMFSDNSDENSTYVPFFDVKREMHAEYFETMARLIPGLEKVIGPSFISEHMLFKKDYVQELINTIESNSSLPGTVYWEKVIHCVGADRIQNSSFSEYETYGTYMAINHPSAYKLREWHSFRLGGEFFDPDTISESDYKWLGRDFTAISFEKNQTVREDHKNLFDNPAYQQKLSAKQMLQVAQEAFEGGYMENWAGEDANTTSGEFGSEETVTQRFDPGKGRLKYLTDDTWLEYARLGENLLDININQSYLCFENAAFLCPDEETEKKNELIEICQELKDSGAVSVRKTCFVILSYNNRYLMEDCLESIYSNCAPGSFSVVILDNASNDGVVSWLKSRNDDDLTLLLSDENLGFAKGCNEALQYTDPNSDILYLNNDTRIPANALFWLRMGLYCSDDIGATGALQSYSSVQLVDVSFDFPEQYMKFGARHNVPVDNPYYEMRKLSGFAMLVSRNVIDIIGGFDETFSPGYFEDDDLSIRIRQAGYRLLLCNNSFIYHAGSQSFAKNPKAESIFELNREKFCSKWGFDGYELDAFASETLNLNDIKLIIWDLDNTFWRGVLSEGGVEPVAENIKLVKKLTDKGIINSICSKNDLTEVEKELRSEKFDNIGELFVFNSIDWTPKADRMSDQIQDMALRPENVLFIDDEAFNREEARQRIKGLNVTGPQIISDLHYLASVHEGNDNSHERLQHYRLLESKREAKTRSSSNEAFLFDSDIRISITADCGENAGRICELINRTNQLNYTKIRLTEAEVEDLISDPNVECRTVRIQDKYGDYGIVGFYAIKKNEPRNLLHFLFSCRVLGMGVEQFVYSRLGSPYMCVEGETAIPLEKDKLIPWIHEIQNVKSTDNDTVISTRTNRKPKVLLKGPCDIDGITPYLAHILDIELETNFVDSREIVVAGSNNTIHLYEAYHTSADAIRRVIADTKFLCEADFITYMFDDEYDALVLSMLSEGHSGLYRHRDTGFKICFGSCRFDMTDPDNWDKYISGEYPNHNVEFSMEDLRSFSKKFVFEGYLNPDESVRNIRWIREKLPKATKLILLLGSEIEADENTLEFEDHASIYREYNRALFDAFAESDDIWLLNITDYISGQDCFEGCTNHYAKKVYYEMADDLKACICREQSDIISGNNPVIIISVDAGQSEYLKQSIDSIRRFEPDAEIIIADKGSNDDYEWMGNWKLRVTVQHSEEYQSFGERINGIIEELNVNQDFLLMKPGFMLTDSCLSAMSELLHREIKAGAAGGLSNGFWGGWQENTDYCDYESAVACCHRQDAAREGQVLALADGVLMVRIDLFRALKGFDPNLYSRSATIMDYCLRLLKDGYESIYTKDVFFWDSTDKADTSERNDQRKMEEKWGMHYFNIAPNWNLPDMIVKEKNEEFNVLEIGCDCGATLLEIRNRFPNVHVYGSEINQYAAGIASCIAEVLVNNIEDCNLPYDFNFFDYIIFGDVLEHLRDPEATVRYCARLLKSGGYIISSIPNVMHISIMEGLLNGDFHYEEFGLLDKTHIHLFTAKEIIRLFAYNGFIVRDIRTVIYPLKDEEQRMIDRLMELSTPEVERAMYETFQYVTLAQKKG